MPKNVGGILPGATPAFLGYVTEFKVMRAGFRIEIRLAATAADRVGLTAPPTVTALGPRDTGS
jgi:hypothetical protein